MALNRYVEGNTLPLFYFGEGISYTTFAYANLTLDPTVKADGTLHISCKASNSGDRDGEEVVQVYVRDELASFQRVALKAGETKTVNFEMRVVCD